MSESKQPRSLPPVKIDVAQEGAPEDVPDPRVERAAHEFSVRHDERNFSILCCAATPRIKGAIAHAGLRKHDVDDVHNNVLLVMWQRRETFAGPYADFVCYGVGFVSNEVRRWRRSQAHWMATTELPRGRSALCGGPEDFDAASSPEAIAAAHEMVTSLPEREGQVVRARGDGYTWEEVAEQLGLSVERVRQIHARAARRIKEER